MPNCDRVTDRSGEDSRSSVQSVKDQRMSPNGCGSKNRYPKWVALVSGHRDRNLRNPACLILSHTQMNLNILLAEKSDDHF